MTEQNSDLDLLLNCLPVPLRNRLAALSEEELLEIVLDLGRPPQARLPGRAIELSEIPVSRDDLAQVVATLGEFSTDNRAGIEGTLHRISAIRNRHGVIIGLTLRVGRAVPGSIELIRDLVEEGRSILLLGRPGVGKTTKLREIARVLADDFGKRVIVIDTSNEIAGDGDIPHRAIGGARRMQVRDPEQQHAVMIEAVENHMPEVIIIDEIGTVAEALAARTIAERGVQLVGTAHGNTLENLVRNPILSELVGGVQTVTLGDEEARLRRSRKTILERKAPPTFDAVVEMRNYEEMVVHADTANSVDRLLLRQRVEGVLRTPAGEHPIDTRPSEAEMASLAMEEMCFSHSGIKGSARIYPYGLSRDLLQRVIRDLRLDAVITNRPERAHLIITLRARAEEARLRRMASANGLPVHVVKKNTTAQLRRSLLNLFNRRGNVDEDEAGRAVKEAEQAVQRALQEGVEVVLPPQPSSIRALQHRVASRYRVVAESVGCEPQRHLVIYPHVFAMQAEG